MSILVNNVTKRFGSFTALDNVSLEVPSGSLVALLGPSGSGKTTLLRIIAGLELPDEGNITVAQENVTKRSARERNIGFVFQHYALFRHMTVFENIAFPLRVRSRPRSEIDQRVKDLLHLIRLDGLQDRYPAQLSGGQRQRVALARALAAEPKLLLLDEPFGALDAKVRTELRDWLRRLHDEIHVTSVFVTHDQEEAFAVADQVAVMNKGRVEQAGTPEDVFEQPANAFVMDFLGNVNVFQGHVRNGRADLGGFEVAYPAYTHDASRPIRAYVRPHELEIERVANGHPGLPARIIHVNPAGSVVRVQLEAEGRNTVIHAEVNPDRYAELGLRPGQKVFASPRRVRLFVPDDNSSLEYAI
jgi:sulfate/thiosulfate transport system ATP-binding protein